MVIQPMSGNGVPTLVRTYTVDNDTTTEIQLKNMSYKSVLVHVSSPSVSAGAAGAMSFLVVNGCNEGSKWLRCEFSNMVHTSARTSDGICYSPFPNIYVASARSGDSGTNFVFSPIMDNPYIQRVYVKRSDNGYLPNGLTVEVYAV